MNYNASPLEQLNWYRSKEAHGLKSDIANYEINEVAKYE